MPIPGPLAPAPDSPYVEQHIWLGPVGNLQELRSLAPGTTAPLLIPSVVHQIAGNGGRVVQRMGPGKRTYQFSGEFLTADDLSVLEAFYVGGYGPGPFVLMEPWRINLLTANQSTGTDAMRDTTGFVANAGTVTSSTAQSDHGSRSLAWAVTAANQQVLTGNLASVTAADDTIDIPVLGSTVYSAQVRARLLGSTGTARLDMRWFTAAEVFISESTGVATALSTSAFTPCPCENITSPAGAALLRLKVQNTAFGAATTIYTDRWQLAQAVAVPAWTVGTGVPRVCFTDELGETYPVHPYVSASLNLTEI